MQERIIDIRNDDDRRFYEIYLPGVKIGQNTDTLPILQRYFRFSDGSVSDGKFEIRNIPEIALDDAIKAGLTKFNVFVDSEMFSDVISCNHAEIQINQKVDFQIDGEYMGEVDYLEVDIYPSAVPVLIKE